MEELGRERGDAERLGQALRRRRQRAQLIKLLDEGYKYLNALARQQRRLGEPVPLVFFHDACTVLTMVHGALLQQVDTKKLLKKWRDFVDEEVRDHGELD